MFLIKTRQIQKHRIGVKHMPVVETFHEIDYAIRSMTIKRRAIQKLKRKSCFPDESSDI